MGDYEASESNTAGAAVGAAFARSGEYTRIDHGGTVGPSRFRQQRVIVLVLGLVAVVPAALRFCPRWGFSKLRAFGSDAVGLEEDSGDCAPCWKGYVFHTETELITMRVDSLKDCYTMAAGTENVGAWSYQANVCKVMMWEAGSPMDIKESAGAVSGTFGGDPPDLPKVGATKAAGATSKKSSSEKSSGAGTAASSTKSDSSGAGDKAQNGKLQPTKPAAAVVTTPTEPLAAEATTTVPPVEASLTPKCGGALKVAGLGEVPLIMAGANKPGEAAALVEIQDGGSTVIPHMGGRAYFGSSCTEGPYQQSEYATLKLLGKRLRYSVDLSGTGCGCNSAFYLSSMPRSSDVGTCSDYYCDAMSVCGLACAEIDLQEGNQHAWFTTMHNYHFHWGPDKLGAYRGFGGGDTVPQRRDWTSEEYGPGGSCVDTTKTFNVSLSFPVDDAGALVGLNIELSQSGQPCQLRAGIDSYMIRWPDIEEMDGMKILGKELAAGMTPVISYWSTDNLQWLDGPGEDGQGPCAVDDASACPEQVKMWGFSLEDLSVVQSSTEVASGVHG